MSVILRPDFPKPHRINAFRGATVADVEEVRAAVNVLMWSCQMQMMGLLENLRENLPLDQSYYLDAKGVYATLSDLQSDLIGRLEQIMEDRR